MPERIPVDVEIAAFWATSSAALELEGAAYPCVAILPEYNNWNDYGHRFLARLLVKDAQGQEEVLNLRTLVAGENITSQYMDRLFEANGRVVAIEKAEPTFVSQLLELDHYRRIVEILGFELAVAALRAIGDAIVVRLEGLDEDRISLIESQEFVVGVLRNASAYSAFLKGRRYLRPDGVPVVEDSARSFTLGVGLPSADNPYVVNFNFDVDPIFKDRIVVLIGRNGTGKTQSLRAIVDRLTKGDVAPVDDDFPHLIPRPSVSRLLVFSSVASDQYPSEISPWRGIDYDYFPITAPPSDARDPLLAALVASTRDDRSVLLEINGEQLDRQDVLMRTVASMGIWQQIYLPLRPAPPEDDLGGIDRDGLRYFPLNAPLNELRTLKLVQQIDWTRQIALFDDEQRVRYLSSGELAMLRFAAQASLAIEQGSLLLLDEPETHLHPNFISDFMEILHNLLAATQSAAIIATHSAYIVREVPRHRVNILTLEDRQIRVDQPRLQTFGASTDTVSQFVFGDTMFAHRYQRALDEWVAVEGAALGLPAIIETYGNHLNRESLSYIARRLDQPPEVQPPQ